MVWGTYAMKIELQMAFDKFARIKRPNKVCKFFSGASLTQRKLSWVKDCFLNIALDWTSKDSLLYSRLHQLLQQERNLHATLQGWSKKPQKLLIRLIEGGTNKFLWRRVLRWVLRIGKYFPPWIFKHSPLSFCRLLIRWDIKAATSEV